MHFKTPGGATFFAAEITSEARYMFNQDLRTGLSIIWNTGRPAMFMIDREELSLDTGCIMFLTEYHRVDDFEFDAMNVVQFNREFYCVEQDDAEVGCRGMLFFGALNIPKVQLPAHQFRRFQVFWDALMLEMEDDDDYKYEMLQTLLRRFLLLSLRLYRKQELYLTHDPPGLTLIRTFNYLVEKHFKQLTKVADYADLLHKSPKTIANTFRKHIDQSPLQVINNRRFLEARRQLLYTDRSVKEIANDINFKDVQAFSHFFHDREGISPKDFRNLRVGEK
ncbi:MAG: helix-turn-helix domain-containing protein [Bacteroidota bacterium]